MELNKIYNEDCRIGLKKIDSDSIDLVITSPPYAERRKKAYGGIPEDEYVNWFVPIVKEIERILSPTGSFFLNIKPHASEGERLLYVFELILAIKKQTNLLFVDEFCWTKNPFPGAYKGRFKNAFEPVYHFTKRKPSKIKFHPIACGTPMKKESIKRAYRKECGDPENGSGMTGMNTANIRHLKLARPSNVINVNNVSNQYTDKKLHPATFPEGLADFFIKSFSDEGDIVLDPFIGSGTTAISAKKLGRKYMGFDNKKEYCKIAESRLSTLE
jgi:site-specific DNA-methyltransferase (adenine-specific)/site-specific DNA-methyltransferase (cytosine-N4-specific)